MRKRSALQAPFLVGPSQQENAVEYIQFEFVEYTQIDANAAFARA